MALAAMAFVGLVALLVGSLLSRRTLDDRMTRLDHRLAVERRQRLDLDALVCVLGHVGSRAEVIVLREYASHGRLDPRAYLPDYPDCKR